MIQTHEDGRQFASDVFETLVERGPEAANSMILSLGRTQLQIAYAALMMKYAELFSEYEKLKESAERLLDVINEEVNNGS